MVEHGRMQVSEVALYSSMKQSCITYSRDRMEIIRHSSRSQNSSSSHRGTNGSSSSTFSCSFSTLHASPVSLRGNRSPCRKQTTLQKAARANQHLGISGSSSWTRSSSCSASLPQKAQQFNSIPIIAGRLGGVWRGHSNSISPDILPVVLCHASPDSAASIV